MRFLGQRPTQQTTPKLITPKPAASLSSVANVVTTPTIFDTLTDEQKQVIYEVQKGNSVVVDSVIGSGKTATIQALVDVFAHSRVLYLTYNRLLKIDAQEKIKNRNATVQNYHGFVYKYLSRRGITCSPDKQIKTFLEKCSDIPLIYDIVCIDEYQDLEEDTVQLLLHIHKECPRAIWVFVGDMAQKIYDKTKVDVYKDCIEQIAPNYVPLNFTQSFRISPAHAEFLSSLWQKHIVGVNKDCQISTIHSVQQLIEVVDAYQNKDVLILGPRYGLTQEIVNYLEAHNRQKYNKETVWTSIRERDDGFVIRPDSLIVTTFDGCKGMERPVTIVIDWTNSHYRTRVEKPFTDQQIITNLFCVAASRGKSRIIFYEDEESESRHLLKQDDLTLAYTQDLPNFDPSSMFEFKHPVDLLRCIDDIVVEEIPQEDKSIITATRADANIDLAPVIGIYQEIIFFKHWNFEQKLSRLEKKPITSRVLKWIREQGQLTPEKKALALTAYSTELYRYCIQATQDLMSEAERAKLIARLSTRLDPNSLKIQVPCHSVSNFTTYGYMDYVDKDGIPYELKFESNLSNENRLQAAMYVVMSKAPYALLWNTRTNQMQKITVPNKDKFLADVYTCITMGRKLRRN